MKPTNYPLIENAREEIRTASGRALAEITLDAVATGTLSVEDIRISRETLQAQAEIADEAGFPQLAANLRRAAELTAVPNQELLRMYEALRPGRSAFAELMALAARLENTYDAPENAKLVREAAQVYEQRGLLKREGNR